MKDIKVNWQKELIDSELKFWDDWFRTKGLDWPEDYAFRIDPETEIQEYLRPFLSCGLRDAGYELPSTASRSGGCMEGKGEGEGTGTGEGVGMKLILDVGSGPLTVLGKRMDGVKLNIICADPLGYRYANLIQKYFGRAPVDFVLHTLEMEKLASHFTTYRFDLVHAQNCVDHSYDPVMAVCQMIMVCKPGGAVFLKHERNEAENEGYNGLHQWNFDCVDGKFVISGAGERTVMDDYLNSVFDGLEMETKLEEGYVVTVIRKVPKVS